MSKKKAVDFKEDHFVSTHINELDLDSLFDEINVVQHSHSTPCFESSKTYKCFWCDLEIINKPLGCPIKQVANFTRITTSNKHNLVIPKENTKEFLTEKVFCSFNCVKAFINSKKHDDYYSDSARLLALMYSLVKEVSKPIVINPSPCKSVMTTYGGNITPQQYRQSFGTKIFKEAGKIIMNPISNLFEEINDANRY